jgi:tRNA (adenine22-N1)-methyltransferase
MHPALRLDSMGFPSLPAMQRMLSQKQQTLTHFTRARQAVPEEKVQEVVRQARWITELLA